MRQSALLSGTTGPSPSRRPPSLPAVPGVNRTLLLDVDRAPGDVRGSFPNVTDAAPAAPTYSASVSAMPSSTSWRPSGSYSWMGWKLCAGSFFGGGMGENTGSVFTIDGFRAVDIFYRRRPVVALLLLPDHGGAQLQRPKLSDFKLSNA